MLSDQSSWFTISLILILSIYLRPHLGYGDVIYHIPAKVSEFDQNMEEVEAVQYFAALAVTGTWMGTSRENFIQSLAGSYRVLIDVVHASLCSTG